jgi:hypothetical protein
MSTGPSWDEAPEWAQFRAQDSDGRWCWFRDEPVQKDHCWSPVNIFWEYAGPPVELWRETLERRPIRGEGGLQ